MSPANFARRLGTTVGGRYHIERLIGSGGMGVVYAAEHVFTRRKVALKLLMEREPSELPSRFLSEARTAAAVSHPNIVDVLDMGIDEEGHPYCVMELLEGGGLDATLAEQGRLSPQQTLTLLLPIVGALATLHERGIVHRDLKPSNIFLSARGASVVPKLLDFGLARELQDPRLTRTGLVVGTPAYMAPEHASGDDVGPQADVWSIGVVFYECLSGRLPFDARHRGALALQVLAGQFPPLREVAPDLSPPIAHVVERALARARDARYADMGELARALLGAAVSSGVDVVDDPDPIGLPSFRSWTREAIAPTLDTPRPTLPWEPRPVTPRESPRAERAPEPARAEGAMTFVAPDFSRPLHAEQYLARVPSDTTCKGMFFNDIVKAVNEASPEAARQLVPQLSRRYVLFRDYPLVEHMELTARAVSLLYPNLPAREGMRRLGWLAYPAFGASLVGRVIFGILGDDLERVLELGPRSFSVSLSRGHATARRMGERHWQYDFTDVYGYLDVYYVGVLEGAIRAFGKRPNVRLHSSSLSDCVMDIRWT